MKEKNLSRNSERITGVAKEGFLKQLVEITEGERKKKKWSKLLCQLEGQQLKFSSRDINGFTNKVVELNQDIHVVPVSSAAPSSLQ